MLSQLRRTSILSLLLATLIAPQFAGTAIAKDARDKSKSAPPSAPLTLPEGFIPAKDKDGKEIPPAATDKEKEWGEKATERLEKNPRVKILDPNKDEQSKALYAKLNDMASKVGRVSARPLIDYKVKVIDDKELNAFTLPNGSIYFFTGLLDILASDDEIAAVMAHEISHNSCMHVIRGDKKAKNLSYVGLAAILAALAGGRNGANVASFTQYALAGIMSSYSVEYEKEADEAGVAAMIATGYNPSAMATVMQRFEVEEKRRPKVELGIFQTHPYSPERVAAIERQIKAAGLDFTPRAVSGGLQAVAVEDKDRVSVKWKDTTLMEFAGTPESTSEISSLAMIRAKSAAQLLNSLMRDNLKMYEIRILESDGAPTLTARGVEIARVTSADATLQKLPAQQVAQKWRSSIANIFWRETVNGGLG